MPQPITHETQEEPPITVPFNSGASATTHPAKLLGLLSEALADVESLSIRFTNGKCLTFTSGPPEPPASEIVFGPDYRSCNWKGKTYSFSPIQANAMRFLHRVWKDRTPDVAQFTVLHEAKSAANRLQDVFKGHPAWGTLVVVGNSIGTYRLAVEQPT